MSEVKLAFGGNRYETLKHALALCKPRRIVEIGVYDGGCACWMIQHSQQKPEDIEYYGFDLFRPLNRNEQDREFQHHLGGHSLPEVEKRILEMGTKSVRLFPGFTKDTIHAAINSRSIEGHVDLIFIDGGHSPETIELDWHMIQPLIGKNTVVVFDDYYTTKTNEGAKMLIDRLLSDPKWKTMIGDAADGIDHQVIVRMNVEKSRVLSLSVPKTVDGMLSGMRFHLPGLAHLPTIRENSACAYTQKIIRLARMLRAEGGYVMFYGVEGSEVECDEYSVVLSTEEWAKDFGDYDRSSNQFRNGFNYESTHIFNRNMIELVNNRKQQKDFILMPMGLYHKAVADAVQLMTVESGIGYGDTFAPFRVFETYTWMMNVYGKHNQGASAYNTVIPNCYDLNEFPFQEKKEDYFIYMGRCNFDKGVGVAIDVAKHLGIKLIIVGQGDYARGSEWNGFSNIERRNAVGPKERSELLGKARGVFVPTQYIEPFGGVAVEAQLCGTPVITTDWGAFPETVLDGVSGFRCHILKDFVEATKNIDKIDPKKCREWAESKFSLAVGQRLYAQYFQRLSNLWGKGWYTV